MKKSQKWGLIPIMILTPAILILAVFFMISDVNLKDIPWWAIIGVPAVILASPFIFFLAQRAQRTENDTPVQKQKKRVLNWFVCFIIFLIIMLVITYYVNYQFFWVLLFCQTPFLLFMFFQNIRPFFPKGKKDEYDNQNNRED